MHFSLTQLGEALRMRDQTELSSPTILLAPSFAKSMQLLSSMPKPFASALIALNNDSPVASATGTNPEKQVSI